MRHLDTETLLMIVEGKLPPRVLLQAMCDHLGELCPECREAMEVLSLELGLSDDSGERLAEMSREEGEAELLDAFADPGLANLACKLEPSKGDDSAYSKAFEAAALAARQQAVDIETERRNASRDLEELLALDPDAWADRVGNAYTRFRSRALAEQMLACCADLTRQDPEKSRRMAELVEDVVARIPGSSGQIWADELKIRAKARQANALRVAGSLPKSDALFRDIHAFLRKESLELEDLPSEVASLEGSLRDDQGRVDEAVELHGLAIRLAQVSGDTVSVASYRISLAEALRRHGRLEEAQKEITPALKSLSPTENPHLYACAIGSQVMTLSEAGRAQEAAETFSRHRSFLETHDEKWVRDKAVYLRGTVYLGLGRLEEAETCLVEARDRMIANDQVFSASNICLDLAELFLETGRTADLQELAKDLVILFQTAHHQHHQRATVALTLFYQASLAEQVTKETIHGLRRTLERAQMSARRSSFLPS